LYSFWKDLGSGDDLVESLPNWNLLDSKSGRLHSNIFLKCVRTRLAPSKFFNKFRDQKTDPSLCSAIVCQESIFEGVSEFLGAYTVRTGPAPFMQNCSVNTQNSSCAAFFLNLIFISQFIHDIYEK
jgi:hypothetical protein